MVVTPAEEYLEQSFDVFCKSAHFTDFPNKSKNLRHFLPKKVDVLSLPLSVLRVGNGHNMSRPDQAQEMNHSSQRFKSAEEFEEARALKPGGTAFVKFFVDRKSLLYSHHTHDNTGCII